MCNGGRTCIPRDRTALQRGCLGPLRNGIPETGLREREAFHILCPVMEVPDNFWNLARDPESVEQSRQEQGTQQTPAHN